MKIALEYKAPNSCLYEAENLDGDLRKAVHTLVGLVLGKDDTPLASHLVDQIVADPQNADSILDWALDYGNVEAAWSRARRYGYFDEAQINTVLNLAPDWNSQLELMEAQVSDAVD